MTSYWRGPHNPPKKHHALTILWKKTSCWFKSLKHTALLPLVILAIGLPLSAEAVTHDVVFTENSSTDLSVTFDGSVLTASNKGKDQWTVTFPDTLIFSGFDLFWAENPTSPTLGNVVEGAGTNQLSVFSDVPTGRDPAGEPNGSTQSQIAIEVATGNLFTVNFAFNDVADGATSVPDTGSTLALLFVSLVVLSVARRTPLRIPVAAERSAGDGR